MTSRISRARLLSLFLAATAFHFIAPGSRAQAQDELPSLSELKRMDVEELMRLEVTSASRRPEPLLRTASAIQVITNEEIRRSGATSLPEALRLATNLQTAQLDQRQWAITARGFNGPLANKLLVLIDGRSVYSPLFAGVFWDLQEVVLEDVERIEVISGPGGTLWGSNAVNGVINIITKSARDTHGLYARVGGGSKDRSLGEARYGVQLGERVHVRVHGKFTNRDGHLVPPDRDSETMWGMGQGGFRLDWEAGESDEVTVQGDLYNSLLARPGPDLVSSGGNLLAQWRHMRPSGAGFELQAYFDRVHRNGRAIFNDVLHTYDLDFQHHLILGARNEIVWGAGYRQVEDDFESVTLTFLPRRITLRTISGFVEDAFSIVPDRLVLYVGTKVEDTEYTGIEVQPNARFAWTPDSRQTLWGSASRAVRTPSRIDRDVRQTELSGTDDYESEKLTAFEAGYRVQPEEHISISFNAFYHMYDDVRSVDPVNPPPLYPATIGNGNEAEGLGAEFLARYHPVPGVRLTAGYTMVDLDIRRKGDVEDPFAGLTEAADSRHHVSFRAGFDLPADLELDAAFRYVSPNTNTFLAVPAYAQLDARLGWRPVSTLSISIVGRNLLHEHHAEFGMPGMEIQRSVFASVAWRY